MKLRTEILFLLFFVLTLTYSCKKNDEPAKSKTEYLTQAGWKLVKAENKTGSGPWVDVTGNPPACEKDDLTIFKNGGVFEYNEGVTKCSPTDPQVVFTGTWLFGSGETTIAIGIGGNPSDIETIETLNDNTLILFNVETISGTTFTEKFTYTH